MPRRIQIAYWIPLAAFALVVGAVLQALFWDIADDWLTSQLAIILGITRSRMIGAIATGIVLSAIAVTAVYLAYLIGVHERKANP